MIYWWSSKLDQLNGQCKGTFECPLHIMTTVVERHGLYNSAVENLPLNTLKMTPLETLKFGQMATYTVWCRNFGFLFSAWLGWHFTLFSGKLVKNIRHQNRVKLKFKKDGKVGTCQGFWSLLFDCRCWHWNWKVSFKWVRSDFLRLFLTAYSRVEVLQNWVCLLTGASSSLQRSETPRFSLLFGQRAMVEPMSSCSGTAWPAPSLCLPWVKSSAGLVLWCCNLRSNKRKLVA